MDFRGRGGSEEDGRVLWPITEMAMMRGSFSNALA
jgi:hypothetical protein